MSSLALLSGCINLDNVEWVWAESASIQWKGLEPRPSPAVELVSSPPDGYSYVGWLDLRASYEPLPQHVARLGGDVFTVNRERERASLYRWTGYTYDLYWYFCGRALLAPLYGRIPTLALWPLGIRKVQRQSIADPLASSKSATAAAR